MNHKSVLLIAFLCFFVPDLYALNEKNNELGVCISGGGTRSFALARGQLAFLIERGVIDRTDVLSMVSGGAWLGVSYFLDNAHLDSVLLGKSSIDPAQLYLGSATDHDVRNLNWMPSEDLGRVPQKFSGLPGFVLKFAASTFIRLFDGSQVWSDFLSSAMGGGLGRSFSKESFPKIPEGMELLVNALLVNELRQYPVEISLDSAVVRNHSLAAVKSVRNQFHSDCKVVKGNSCREKPLRIQDALAATSANYANFNAVPFKHYILPSYQYPVGDSSAGSDHWLVDSGHVDYLGIMPLLARGVKKIIAFVNTDIPIKARGLLDGGYVVGVEKAVSALFGYQPDEKATGDAYRLMSSGGQEQRYPYLRDGRVFESTQYVPLVETLFKKKVAGDPTVVLQKGVRVVKNTSFGIEGGYRVDILWVYNDLPSRWWKQLSPEVAGCISGGFFNGRSKGCYKTYFNFPHYNALFDLYLESEQVKLLSNMAYWMLRDSSYRFLEWFN